MRDVELRNRIRVFRAARDLTQADLAALIGVSRKTISTIEVGRFVPSTTLALLIAREFGVAVEEVFWIDDDGREDVEPRERRPVSSIAG